ncbi:MAG: hypothetical protein ACKVRN_12735 [Pyrinomonadaceae bacterium]
MKNKLTLIISLFVVMLTMSIVTSAQVNRPYHDGSVWDIAFIKVKPGQGAAYMNYLATDWKRNQEAMKKAGLILSYMVVSTEAHGANDWNLMLMTEFKDLASMEAGQDKADQLMQTLVGDDAKASKAMVTRGEMRELMGDRLARQIILEPKK